MKQVYLALLLALIVSQVFSQTRTITGSGNWNTSNRWTGNNIGGDGANTHDVTMNNAIDITIVNNDNYTIASFGASKEGSLTVNGGTPGGILIITGNVTIDKEFTINIAGDVTVQGNLIIAKELTLNVSGNLTIVGNVSIAKEAGMTVDGSVDIGGTLTMDKESTLSGSGNVDVTGICTTVGTPDLCQDTQIVGLLPIELLSIKSVVNAEESTVHLNWITATEIDNEYFTIKRTRDGKIFTEVGLVAGAGNSDSQIAYSFVDENPLPGLSYYQLTQTDYDGTSETFKLV